MPYRHQSYYFRSSDKCILLPLISNPALFISSKRLHHSQSYPYRFPKFHNKILLNRRDQNNIWCRVVANFQNVEMHVQYRASS